MNRKTKLILILILVLSFFLRLDKLKDYPVGFHIDEASLGYNAYSILQTGRDENGVFLPLHIDMFGDFRPAGYQYLTVLPVKIFGLSEFSTRFVSALFGAATPLVVFLLAMTIFDQVGVALLSAGLVAVSPWHLVISRASAETIVALFLIILGINFFVLGLKGQKTWLKSGIFLSASLFFYHTPRVFVPLLVLTLLVTLYSSRRYRGQKQFRWPLGILLLVTGLSLFLIFGNKGGTGRFNQVSIFSFPEVRLVLEEQIREDGVAGIPVFLTRFFHNKVVNYGLGYLREYFRYFSPNFLFIDGGLPRWYQVPRMGLLYLTELPFLLIGLFLLLRKGIKEKLFLIPVVWLLSSPVVAAVTIDDVPNVQRSLVMLPALILISAYGLWWFWQWFSQRINRQVVNFIVAGLILVFSWNFAYFLHQYFVHARLHQPWYRFNGFKEMVLTVDGIQANYDKVMVTKSQGGIYMHFLFFQQFDPKQYQAIGSPKDNDYQGFGKIIFTPKDCPTRLPDSLAAQPSEKVLFVGNGSCEESIYSSSNVRLIRREDGTVVFRIAAGEG